MTSTIILFLLLGGLASICVASAIELQSCHQRAEKKYKAYTQNKFIFPADYCRTQLWESQLKPIFDSYATLKNICWQQNSITKSWGGIPYIISDSGAEEVNRVVINKVKNILYNIDREMLEYMFGYTGKVTVSQQGKYDIQAPDSY